MGFPPDAPACGPPSRSVTRGGGVPSIVPFKPDLARLACGDFIGGTGVGSREGGLGSECNLEIMFVNRLA